MTIQDYLSLITSEHADKPNFNAVVSFSVAPYVQIQTLLEAMIPLFDLHTPPVGDQLDVIGDWVGASRNVNVPIPGVYFTWDGAADVGWDYGVWQISGAPTEVTVLPDDSYLTLIRATIAANSWDGTTYGAYEIFDTLFTGTGIEIAYQDYENMSYAVIITGAIIDSLTLALITGGYIKLRPEGIQVTKYFIGGLNPIFAWDLNTSAFQGWDTGYWATEKAPS